MCQFIKCHKDTKFISENEGTSISTKHRVYKRSELYDYFMQLKPKICS